MSCTFWNLRRRKKAVTKSKLSKSEERRIAAQTESEPPVKKAGGKNGK